MKSIRYALLCPLGSDAQISVSEMSRKDSLSVRVEFVKINISRTRKGLLHNEWFKKVDAKAANIVRFSGQFQPLEGALFGCWLNIVLRSDRVHVYARRDDFCMHTRYYVAKGTTLYNIQLIHHIKARVVSVVVLQRCVTSARRPSPTTCGA